MDSPMTLRLPVTRPLPAGDVTAIGEPEDPKQMTAAKESAR
jgi:hypothetical protein